MSFESLNVDNLLNRIDTSIIQNTEIPSSNITSGELTGDLFVNKGFLRSKDYVDGSAGWTVNDDGTAQFSDITLIGGILKFGKTSFADTVNAGYYISSDGIYIGGASDSNYLKYDITGATFTLYGINIDLPTITNIQSGSEISIQGWQQNITFSATVYNSLAHTAGTITLLDGTTYDIRAQTWINISSLFYIYLDINISTTELQASYSSANAVGSGKILIAVARNSSDVTSTLTYQVFGGKGGTNLAVDNISANSASTNEFISNTAQIKDLIVTNAKIDNLDAAKITTGTLLVGRTQAKCTDANADETQAALTAGANIDNAKANGVTLITGGYITTGIISANNITTGTLLVGNTQAKCTDANADETSANTSANTEKVQNYTIISGGYIATGVLTATNINTGTLTGRTVQTSSNSTLGCKLTAASGLKIYGQYATWYSSSTAVGQIYASSTTNLQIYTYSGKTLELGGANGASLNAGANNCELRTSNSAHIRCDDTNYSGFVGTSSKVFGYMYSSIYYFAKSGATTKYLQLNASSGIDCSANFYVAGTLSKAAGSFKINHPLKPDTHWLQHSFVESPDMLNIYTGNGEIINGVCVIEMPDWFIPLNGSDKNDFTYQLTSIGNRNDLWVKDEMNKKGIVKFAGNDGKFSYTITAIRHDKYALENPIKIELKK